MSAGLRYLLDGFAAVADAEERFILSVTMDSRKVSPGALFLACAGEQTHGGVYLDAAIAQGAAAVALETDAQSDMVRLPGRVVPVIAVPKLRSCAGVVAARFYHHPSVNLNVIGVTGTNGKTSVTQFIARALADDAPAGIIGTLGSGLVDQLATTGHTTPDAVSVQATLAELLRAGARAVAMEVSSHGLHQGRVAGTRFKVAVFTNLTHEHLDYHGDMAGYAAAKRLLFDMPGLAAAVINQDDATGRDFARELASTLPVIGFGFDPLHDPAVLGSGLMPGAQGLAFDVATAAGRGRIESPLIGPFNASNLLAALGTLLQLGLPLDVACARLSRLRAVPGRMERFGGGPGRPIALVDYAHTPDALEQVLAAARAHTEGRLICVFGCGGDRDRSKRPIMGQVAERLADAVVLTDDNPRFEDPESIVEEIKRGMSCPERIVVIRDRARAIANALEGAREGDVVVVAGKGHEIEQQIGERKWPFSDRQEVARWFGEEVAHG